MIRSKSPLRRALAATALLSALCAPVRLPGQTSSASRWSVQPSAGVFIDPYDVGDDGSQAGALASVQVGWRFAELVHAVASLGYARVNDVGSHGWSGEAYHVLRHDWVFAAVGPAIDMPLRRATVTLSVQAGAAWHRSEVSGIVGNPAPDPWLPRSSGFSVGGIVLPGLAVRYPVARWLSVVGGASAYVLSPDGRSDVSPAYTLGVFLTP